MRHTETGSAFVFPLRFFGAALARPPRLGTGDASRAAAARVFMVIGSVVVFLGAKKKKSASSGMWELGGLDRVQREVVSEEPSARATGTRLSILVKARSGQFLPLCALWPHTTLKAVADID